MTRRQLRPFYGRDELAGIYGHQYDHERWPDHILRVAHTAGILRNMNPSSVADLSCGDGSVITQAALACPAYRGDLAAGWEYRGPIELTITQIPQVDVFVCSETLEHVEDPDLVLRAIRDKATRLLLTTPEGESSDANPEHYWGWIRDDLRDMLTAAGWAPDGNAALFAPYPSAYYTYQIWMCH